MSGLWIVVVSAGLVVSVGAAFLVLRNMVRGSAPEPEPENPEQKALRDAVDAVTAYMRTVSTDGLRERVHSSLEKWANQLLDERMAEIAKLMEQAEDADSPRT